MNFSNPTKISFHIPLRQPRMAVFSVIPYKSSRKYLLLNYGAVKKDPHSAGFSGAVWAFTIWWR